MNSPIFELRKVHKKRGASWVLDGVDLRIEGGEIVMLCGKNGAGKSTLLQVCAGAIAPDRGSIHLDDTCIHKGPAQVRHQVGYAPDSARAFENLTPCEYLGLVASLRNTDPPTLARAQAMSIDSCWYRPLARCSLGQRQRVLLLAAQVGQPQVLLLDEPTSGLNPEGRQYLANELRAHAQRKGLALVATHDDELVKRCEGRQVFLVDGKLQHKPSAVGFA